MSPAELGVVVLDVELLQMLVQAAVVFQQPGVGAAVYYEPIDGATSGYCAAEAMGTSGGPAGVCSFEFVWGVPVRLTLNTATLAAGTVLVSPNPIDYLVQENLGGAPSVPIFELGPA